MLDSVFPERICRFLHIHMDVDAQPQRYIFDLPSLGLYAYTVIEG